MVAAPPPCPPPLAGLAVLAPSRRHADVTVRVRRPRGVVLVLHAGGFIWGSAQGSARFACQISRWGYDAVSVDYPPTTTARRCVTVRRRARAESARRLPVFAVGESAGGTLAIDLAAQRLVRGAVAVAASSDLVRWNGVTDADYWRRVGLSALDRRRWSPLAAAGARSAPLLLAHSRADHTAPFAQSARLHARVRRSVLCRLSGDHRADRSCVTSARRWLGLLARSRTGVPRTALDAHAICPPRRAPAARPDALQRRG